MMSKSYGDYYAAHSRSSISVAGRSESYQSPYAVRGGADLSSVSIEDRLAMMDAFLRDRIYGISFSPYMDGQSPGMEISEQQIRSRLKIISPYVKCIRTFSCTEGNQHTPRIAHELGLRTIVGVCISDDLDMNELELKNGIKIAQEGHADVLAIGNEVLLRGDLSEQQLIEYIARVKQQVPGVTVSYVDAYFLFENHPAVTELCDVLLINCYPFWESCPADHALLYMQEMYRRVQRIANGKNIIISETGWPNFGAAFGGAVPGTDSAIDYFIKTYEWANAEGIDVVYFSSFDELWKTGDEGDVGAYWGLWDSSGKRKYI